MEAETVENKDDREDGGHDEDTATACPHCRLLFVGCGAGEMCVCMRETVRDYKRDVSLWFSTCSL